MKWILTAKQDAVNCALVCAPMAVALLTRGRDVRSDYAPEWWTVMISLAIAVGYFSLRSLFSRKPLGRAVAIAAMFGVAAAAVYEAGLGIAQIAGLMPSTHSAFRLTGTFYNPGPYGGFIAMGLPIGLSLCLGSSRVLQRTGMAVVFLTLIVLPASQSRSAWVAAGLASGFVLLCHRRRACIAWLRRWWLPLAVVILAAAAGAYLLKADSANGRLLMWRIGLKACTSHPWGVGWHGVAGAYGDAQQAYFASGCATPGEMAVAGAPEYLFNEYLQIALAWGWPAAVAFVAVLASAVVASVRIRLYGAGGAVIAFAVFSFSSYPLQFPLFVAAVTMLTVSVIFAAWTSSRLSATMLSAAGLAAVALLILSSQYHHRKAGAYDRWQHSRYFYRSAHYPQAVKAMTAFGDTLSWNPNFMFELGHSLNLTGDYAESNSVLARAARICGDPMIFNIRGKNFQSLDLVDSAVIEFQRAADRIPNRIYPHYLMMCLAAESEPVDSALLLREARIILEMPVKVMSPAVKEMQEKAREVISDRSDK